MSGGLSQKDIGVVEEVGRDDYYRYYLPSTGQQQQQQQGGGGETLCLSANIKSAFLFLVGRGRGRY